MKILNFLKKSESDQSFQNLYQRFEKLLDLARNLYTQSEELKRVVEAEKIAVQKSSSASHEISSMVSTTADATKDLSKVALASNEAVTESVESLKTLSQLISKVNESSQTLQATVKNGLTEISSVTETMIEIKNKANVINEIVFQTKLLSFNASVEAARAGEHGKGFAVVAEEMGKLARASGQAAKEIEEILTSSVERTKTQITRVTKELENAAHDTVQVIKIVSQKTNDISKTFDSMETYSKNTESKSQEISNATNEQRIGVEEISKSLHDLENSSHALDNMAVENNKVAANLADSIDTISNEFLKLSKSLGYDIAQTEKEFDFAAAAKAHIDWKMKLSKYMEKPDGSLDHKHVCKDNACKLGLWIYNEGQSYRPQNPSLFDQLKKSHADFHVAAGEIVQAINNGDLRTAEKLLGPQGEYLAVSEKTVGIIRQYQSSTGLKKVA